MIYTELTKRAMCLACAAHEGQQDKGGFPYIHHPLHVAERMTTELSTVTALLHDVVEDTDWTLERLQKEAFPEEVLEALALLTHKKGVPYLDYVRALRKNPIAREVKLRDLRHNSDLSRLEKVTEKDMARVKKYARAIRILEEET